WLVELVVGRGDAEPVFGAGDSGAVWDGEEGLDFAGGPHQPTAGGGRATRTGDFGRQSRPVAADSDDGGRVHRGHGPAARCERAGGGGAAVDCGAGGGRDGVVAVAHAARGAGDLFDSGRCGTAVLAAEGGN